MLALSGHQTIVAARLRKPETMVWEAHGKGLRAFLAGPPSNRHIAGFKLCFLDI